MIRFDLGDIDDRMNKEGCREYQLIALGMIVEIQ